RGEGAIIARERRQWEEAGRLAGRALAALEDGHLEGYVVAAFVHAVAARAALAQGEAVQAREHLARAVPLRPLLTSAMPPRAVQTLVELARAYLALDDVAGARTALRQADEIIGRLPHLGGLPGPAARPRGAPPPPWVCCPARPPACGRPSTGSDRARPGRRPSPPPSCACCRCCRPTSPCWRSASGCTCPATRPRPSPSRSPASSGCPPP